MIIPPSENYRRAELLSILSAPEFLTTDGRRERERERERDE